MHCMVNPSFTGEKKRLPSNWGASFLPSLMWSMALWLGSGRKIGSNDCPSKGIKFQVCQICFWWVFWGHKFHILGGFRYIYIYTYTLFICIYIYIYTWNPNGSPCFVWSVCLGLGKEDLSKNWLVMAGFTGAKKNFGRSLWFSQWPTLCISSTYIYFGRYILCILLHSMANL